MQYYIGIDMGTTNTKAVLFQEDGAVLASAKQPTPFRQQPDGGTVCDPEALWGIVCGLLSQVASHLEREALHRIGGIAVTGMGEAGVPLDRSGAPLYPIIAWYDPRTLPYVRRWQADVGAEKLLDITALRNQHIFTANKLQWLRDNEPSLFQRMQRWHCVPDYISYRLTGRSAIDYSLAARTMLFDLKGLCWSPELTDYVGVSRDILPPPLPSGSLIGPVTPEAAAACALPAGIPVFTGGHDHICGAYAVGAFRPGCLLDSSGTAEEVLLSSPQLEPVYAMGRKGYNVGPHVFPGQYYLSGGIPASGASVDWSRRQFRDAPVGTPGANGLLFLPHLRGGSSPERNPTTAGTFLGIRDRHDVADLRQAVYEGVCLEMRLLADALLDSGSLAQVVSIGGGTKDPLWLQTKADVLAHPVIVPEVQESTALGAALLAAVGSKRYESYEDAFLHTFRIGATVLPRPEYAETYQTLYQKFKKLYPSLSKLYDILQ